ncbi:PIN domain-containing protein [Yimella lutea]|uniref:PIN domain-containing protein n=2 Tax=Yimella lutea TaxID=587872 RepID=A0A542EEI7_9MICO|nr:PIN domain-containing protein [Yimella lutea]
MLLPAIVPLPGVPLSNAIEMVQHWKYELERVRQSSAEESLATYQRWAPLASEVLGSTFGLFELESLIATLRHDTLLQLHAGDSHSLINGVISAELTDRMRAFDVLLQSLKDLDARCNALPKSYSPSVLVPDTNVLLHQDEPFDELDWKALIPTSDDVRVVIPMVVIRELDRHKRSPANNVVSRNNKEAVRDRARRTSRELGVLFARPMDVVTLHPRAVTMELLLDSVGHVPAGDPDRELIERASALKGVTDRNVAIVTSDNGMKFAAAVAGIDVISTNN